MTNPHKIFLLLTLFTIIVSLDEIPSPFQQSDNINEDPSSDKTDDNSVFCSNVYEKKHSSWLPPNYIFNAKCACQAIPSTSKEGSCIRQFLADRLDDNSRYNSDFKNKLISLKSSEEGYSDIIMNEFVPKIQQDHIDAYKACGCTGSPAGDWAWKRVVKYKYLCNLIKLGMKILEGCHGVLDNWKTSSETAGSGALNENSNEREKERIMFSERESGVFNEKGIEEEGKKDLQALLEMIGALLFSLIIMYSVFLYCRERQRQAGKLEEDVNNLNESNYTEETVYFSNTL